MLIPIICLFRTGLALQQRIAVNVECADARHASARLPIHSSWMRLVHRGAMADGRLEGHYACLHVIRNIRKTFGDYCAIEASLT